MKENNYFYPLISSVAFIITCVVNYGAMVGWFGMTQEEISNQYQNWVTPASYAFSIWGLIYSLVLLFLIYQAYLLFQNRYMKDLLDPLNHLFIETCVWNIFWNVAWVSDWIILSTICIIFFAGRLYRINRLILKGIYPYYHILIPVTFSIYFGWLSVATVTNITALLVKLGWDMPSALSVIVAAIIYLGIAWIAQYFISKTSNVLYNLPIIWAMVGILVNVIPLQPSLLLIIVSMIVILVLCWQIYRVYQRNGGSILPSNVEMI